MEVPMINRLSNFDGGHVTCLQNPSLLSQILSIKAFQAHSFWKWSAFIIAMIASFGTLITRIRIIIIRLQSHYCNPSSNSYSSSSSEPLMRNYNGSLLSDYSDDDDIDEDDVVSCSSISDFDDDDDDAISTTSFGDGNEQDFHVRGSGFYGDNGQGQDGNFGLRRGRFSWSDFSSGKSVVKLWDSFGFAYDEDEDDFDDNARSSPVAMLSGNSGRVRLGVWDARVGCRIPAILAEWGPQFGRIVGGGGGKVYVRDDVTGDLAIGDVRRFDSLYGFDELSSSDSAVTRCCDAVKSYLL